GDDDQPLPAGKYHARGYVVGDLEVEGVGFYFNDWATDETPQRIERICAIAAETDGVIVAARVAHDGGAMLICDTAGRVVTMREDPPTAECGDEPQADILAEATGKDQTRWTIERLPDDPGRVAVKQYSATGESLRSLAIAADAAQPRQIAASHETDRIYLLEEDATGQRLRGLSLLATNPGGEHSISDWKVDFEKKITAHKGFGIDNGKPVASGGTAPPEKVTVKLKPNPLQNDARGKVELSVSCQPEGSVLKTADGLPLQTISETKHLTRVVIAPHGGNAIDVFQDDDAVVEQFRVSGLDEMMAFDCGEIELK
ncbi:MAG: hypothetical protein M3Y80_06140, partial [Verrucomicrobiota bacterium]|nr:hypothetical protein [Verrucomicrobiota bacterium]